MKKNFAGVLISLTLVLVLALVLPVMAQGNSPLDIELTAHLVLQGEGGKERLVAATEAKPGEVIEYAARYRNRSTGALNGVQGVVPIPEALEYLPGTASPAKVEASTDGERFAPAPIMRTVRLASGREEERPVPYSEYRALRWQLGSLAPDAEVVVKARARVLEK